MAGYYINYVGAVSTMLLCSWAAVHLQGEPEVRTVLFASGTIFAYLMNAFIPIAAFPAKEAPNWRIGAKLYLAFAVLAAIVFVGIHFAFKWDRKRKVRRAVKGDTVGEPENADDDNKVFGGFVVKGL
jgi:ACS family pantothenate transporter-like MFS transporter